MKGLQEVRRSLADEFHIGKPHPGAFMWNPLDIGLTSDVSFPNVWNVSPA